MLGKDRESDLAEEQGEGWGDKIQETSRAQISQRSVSHRRGRSLDFIAGELGSLEGSEHRRDRV